MKLCNDCKVNERRITKTTGMVLSYCNACYSKRVQESQKKHAEKYLQYQRDKNKKYRQKKAANAV